MNPISVNPEIHSGTPCFSGTRVPVKALFDCLKAKYNLDEFICDFPSVKLEQALEVLSMAAQLVIPAPIRPASHKAADYEAAAR